MIPISIAKLADILGAEITGTQVFGGDKVVTGVSTDSRTVGVGDCFFAIPGENFDGHDHIGMAFDCGAICAVSQNDCGDFARTVLKVDDTIEAMGDLTSWYRGQMGAKVIAITGSAGKTTTRQIAYHVISQHFSCHQSPKSFNNNIGLPLTIFSTKPEDEILIIEIGANAPGEIACLTAIGQPDIAVVTNIHPAHLEGFGSIENIVKEKASISWGLCDGGVFLVNGDFAELIDHCDGVGHEYVSFGTSEGCDIRASGLKSTGASGELVIDGVTVSVPLAGRANLENALAAWAICRELGISIGEFAEGIKTLDSVDMRLEIEKAGTVTIINDCYNANPASMANAVECLGQVAAKEGGRAVFVCGQMAELGAHSERLHVELGHLAGASVGVLAVCGPYAEITAGAAMEKAAVDFEVLVFSDTDELCNKLVDIVRDDDIILVKGSRSAGLERAVEKLRELFSR